MRDDEYWRKEAVLKDMLFESNMPLSEIANRLYITRPELNALLKKTGLSWVKRNNRKLSRGHSALTQMMQRILPNEEIVNEFHIGERLRLDIYCPSYNLAAEYHGRQHFFFSSHFHDDLASFHESVERDRKKEEVCRENGIALVVFRFSDELSEEAVFRRMLEAIKATPKVETVRDKKIYKGHHYYEKVKKQNKDYRKAKYRELKKKNGFK